MLTALAPRTWHDHVEVHLVGGLRADLRPLDYDETAPLLAVFEQMSELSRAHRYLTGMPQLPQRLLHRLADVDDPGRVAWLASIDGRPVGIGRYAAHDHERVDMAFEVIDAYHRRGIGSALVDTIATVALANGFTSVTATVDPTNRASVALLHRIGLRLALRDGLLEGEGLLLLPDPPRVDRAAVLGLVGARPSMPGLNQVRIPAPRWTQ